MHIKVLYSLATGSNYNCQTHGEGSVLKLVEHSDISIHFLTEIHFLEVSKIFLSPL